MHGKHLSLKVYESVNGNGEKNGVNEELKAFFNL